MQLRAETTLAKMGFRICAINDDDPDVADEEESLAEAGVRFAREVVARRLLHHLAACFSVPDRLAGVLSPDPAVVKQTLSVAKIWTSLLLQMEQEMVEHEFLAELHKKMQWPRFS